MSQPHHDPELEDVLQDDELRHIASALSSVRSPEPPLDDAFRTGLRRQLMQEAWAMSQGKYAWWRRMLAPPSLAWGGATAGLLLIASVVVFFAMQPSGGLSTVIVGSPLQDNRNVSLQQPILVAFNQPMDHQTTQDAVQVKPATSVAFAWDQQSRTLAVQPVGGALAPNTQYQVTVGPGARTQAGQPLATPQTITFVTQAPPSPAPAVTPRPTPANPLSEKQLASLDGAATFSAQWSSDSTSIYFVDGKGALVVVPVKGGNVAVIAADGASSPSMSPAGDRLVYLRANKIEVLTFATGKTDEIVATTAPVVLGWAKDRVEWVAVDGVYSQGSAGAPTRVSRLPTTGTVTALSIAPDGAHVVYTQDSNLFVLDVSTEKSTQVGQANATFAGWSPGGAYLMSSGGDVTTIADLQGVTQATIPSGDATWSSQDAILLGTDTELYQVWADGTGGTKMSSGTYRSPLWAPNGTAFVFVRGSNVWAGVAPALPARPTPLDEAGKVVASFMDARLKGQTNEATQLLDENGKHVYGDGGLGLLIQGDPHFTRYYVLTQQLVATQPDTVRVVVRMVLTHGKLDVSNLEETLTLVRDTRSRLFFIDQATAGPHSDLGTGAAVVSVDVTADTVKVTFDSDLDPGTVSDGIHILDARGKQLDATTTYANRTVTMTGLDLKEGARYRLSVLTTVRDVLGHNIAAEYGLDLVGPTVKKHGSHQEVVVTPAPAASPSPSTTG